MVLCVTVAVVGFTNGTVYVLDALTLKDETAEPFHYARDAITQIVFSHDSRFFATAVSPVVPQLALSVCLTACLSVSLTVLYVSDCLPVSQTVLCASDFLSFSQTVLHAWWLVCMMSHWSWKVWEYLYNGQQIICRKRISEKQLGGQMMFDKKDFF